MSLIENFLTQYLGRGLVLSVVGAILAVAGLLFGSTVGLLTLEVLGIGSESIVNSSESTIESGTLQFVGLMFAAVFFVFSNSALNQIPIVNSFAGFNNSISEALPSILKSIVLVAIPITISIILSTVILSQWMFLDNGISRELRNTTIISTMSVFPMVMFYQIGVQELTM
jgi:hypothetical protein